MRTKKLPHHVSGGATSSVSRLKRTAPMDTMAEPGVEPSVSISTMMSKLLFSYASQDGASVVMIDPLVSCPLLLFTERRKGPVKGLFRHSYISVRALSPLLLPRAMEDS